MNRIFLIGYMGAGKTTIGRELAALRALSFIDLDHFIERRYHKTVRQLFVEEGEERFRVIEQKLLHEVAAFEEVIISTGGGTPCFHDNLAFMNSKGTTIYLKASAEEIYSRLRPLRQTRPLIKDLSDNQLKEFVEDSLKQRHPFYKQATITVETGDIETKKEVHLLTKKINLLF